MEFLDFTDPTGDHHIALQTYLAKKWLNEPSIEKMHPNLTFKLRDAEVQDEISGTVDTTSDIGISISFSGYGDCCHEDGYGSPVFIEKYDGNVMIRIYGDINSEEPTHNISLEGAKLNKRLIEEVGA